MVPTCFSKFTPYSLSVQYFQVENVFSRNILLVPLSVFEGKKNICLYFHLLLFIWLCCFYPLYSVWTFHSYFIFLCYVVHDAIIFH